MGSMPTTWRFLASLGPASRSSGSSPVVMTHRAPMATVSTEPLSAVQFFYGHATDGHDSEDSKHTNNVWWYQGDQANKIFRTLDDKEQARALVAKAEADAPKTTPLKGDKLPATGLAVAELDSQQKAMVGQLLEMMLRPFRAIDAEELRECLACNGGVDKLHLTFFKENDLGNDGVWNIWKLEGPAFSWYLRGSPRVHTWLNVARKA